MTKPTNKQLAPYTRKQLEAMARVKQVKAAKAKVVPKVQVTGDTLDEIHYAVSCIKTAVQNGVEHDKNQATALAWIAIGVITNLVAQTFYLYLLAGKH
jgi:hypothetical protein